MTKYIGFLVLICLCYSCKTKVSETKEQEPIIPSATIETQSTLQKIAFGSCNKSDSNQPMWSIIDQHNPELWIWLGDIIYADTEDMAKMSAKYFAQKTQKEYQPFRSKYPIIGIWDDHDYGENDGDRLYVKKKESKALLLDFLDVPKNALVRNREGAYQRFTFGKDSQQVKVILLDARYFRDELIKDSSRKSRYLPNPEGSILGEKQWNWLEDELAKNEAAIHIIACGIQMIPEEHRFEKWANFPKERQRLFDLLQKVKPNKTILISGDRHIAEVSKMNLPNLDYPLFEVTSSGLTHSYEAAGGEQNKHRVGNLTGQKNFGLLLIDWEKTDPILTIEIRGVDNNLIIKETLN